MSDVLPPEVIERFRSTDRKAYWEQRLFVLSPFGTLATAVLIFAIFASTYLVAAAIDGDNLLDKSGELSLSHASWLALVLSILLTTILAVQRAVRLWQRSDTLALAQALRGGIAQAAELGVLSPLQARLWLANTVGLVIAAGFDYLLYFWHAGPGGLAAHIWFSIITALLVLTFTRGVELTRAGSKSMVQMIDDELIVDLLRIDELTVFGRNAARFAVIWFSVSAAACLLFVNSEINTFTVALLAGCLVMGFGTFVLMMERVHQKIRRVKHAELDGIRDQIDAVKSAAAGDATAAARLQGLLAYESRIMAAQEWPFDQTTLVRVCASALILTVPWFGQAIAAYVVDHLSRFTG